MKFKTRSVIKPFQINFFEKIVERRTASLAEEYEKNKYINDF